MQKTAAKIQIKYQDILIHEFETRSRRNSSYSLRAYARDLGLSVSSLSRVLTGKQGLSPDKCKQMCKALGMNETESSYFESLVKAAHARSQKVREHAQLSLRSDEIQVTELSLEYFKTISDWHYYAIIELTGVSDFENNPRWIAKRLGISEKTVKESIARLLKLELIEEVDHTLRKTEGFRATPSGIPNRSIQEHHRQLLKKAETALVEQSVEERDFSNVTFSMNSEDLAWAREEMKKFRRELTQRLASSQQKDRLYQLSLHLFALDSKPNKRSKT